MKTSQWFWSSYAPHKNAESTIEQEESKEEEESK